MNKYEEALKSFEEAYRNVTLDDELTNEKRDALKELIDKETPMKPKMVMLFGEQLPICPNEYCGVGVDPNETIWHKSRYCGNCGQHIDWSKENE